MKSGKYEFKKEEIGLAHQSCLERCEYLMRNSADKIIIANTSTTERELKPYYELSIKYNYRVFSLIVENRHGGKNIHNVPETTLKKMDERFSIKL
jgi:uroporphyrinogen-III decarboxylase